MATLAESFLADLDELDEELPDAGGAPDAAAAGAAELVNALTAAVQPNNLDAAAPLVNSVRYRRIMQEVDAALARTHNDRARTGPLEADPEYKVRGRMCRAYLCRAFRALTDVHCTPPVHSLLWSATR